jgi:septal ring-binding cell division protein DamX
VSSPARRSAGSAHPLLAHADPAAVVAWRRGEAVSAARFLADVDATARALPQSRHVLNFCADRYRFAVLLAAAIVRGQVTLLPPTTTPHVIASMRAFAPDAYYVTDDPAIDVDLPRHALAESAARPLAAFEVPVATVPDSAASAGVVAETPEPVATSPGVPAGQPAFGLQVASFRTPGRAGRVLDTYVDTTGLPGEIQMNSSEGGTWYRIVLGRFANEATARAAGDDLLSRSLIAERIVIPYTPQQP